MNASTRCPGVYMSAKSVKSYPVKRRVCIAAATDGKNFGKTEILYSAEAAESVFGAASESNPITAAVYAAFSGGAYEVAAAGCADDDDYIAAAEEFKSFGGVAATVIGCCSDSAVSAAKKLCESKSFCILPLDNSLSDDELSRKAQSFNLERLIAVCQPSEIAGVTSCVNTAAAIAGVISSRGFESYDFSYASLNGIKFQSKISDTRADFLLKNGITPVNKRGGEIVRLVTTRTQSGGKSDYSLSDVSSVMISDDIIASAQQALTSLLESCGTNSLTYSAVESRMIILMEEKKDSGLIESYKKPEVYSDEHDKTLCHVDLGFTVRRGINSIFIQAEIGL